MLVAIETVRHVRAPNPSTLGRDLIFSWSVTGQRELLASLDIEYVYRGYTTYAVACRGRPEPWVEHVIAMGEADYDIVKLALGRVRMLLVGEDRFTDITNADHRKTLRMSFPSPEEWEAQLSNPPKKTTIIEHFK